MEVERNLNRGVRSKSRPVIIFGQEVIFRWTSQSGTFPSFSRFVQLVLSWVKREGATGLVTRCDKRSSSSHPSRPYKLGKERPCRLTPRPELEKFGFG